MLPHSLQEGLFLEGLVGKKAVGYLKSLLFLQVILLYIITGDAT
jgi:hypothetical protein